ncbi:MAG: DUF308 domain-containing protein [Treponema sp.]|nr:DUF308 domain-containing protein [Treponema sp.]
MDKKNITTGVLLVAVGLLVLLNPETCIKVLIILLGAFSVVKGIYDLAKMRSVSDDDVYKRVLVVESLVSILIGIAALVAPFALFNTVQEIVRIMLYVLAVYHILEAFACFFLAIKLKGLDVEKGVAKSIVHRGCAVF